LRQFFWATDRLYALEINQRKSKMPSGGRRVVAGRKAGAATKRTREIANQAAAAGKMPLGVMLDNMRYFANMAESAEAAIAELSAAKIAGMPPDEQFKYLLAEVKKAAGLRELAQSCARDAASYVHPRLSSTAVKVKEKRDRFDWTREELLAIVEDGRADDDGGAGANECDGKRDQVH
jgi:hypothetical protein